MKYSSLTGLLAISFFSIFLIGGCTSYEHPNLQVRQLGWQPDRDLASYLNTDSMIQSLDQIRGTKQKLDSLLEWTDLLNYHYEEAALDYATQAYQLAVEKGFRFSQATSMYYRSLIKGRQQLVGEGIEDALADAMISHRLLHNSDDPVWLVRINGLLGYLYYRNRRSEQSFVDSARHYATLALEMTEKITGSEEEVAYFQGQLYDDLAETYRRIDSVKTVQLYTESIRLGEISGNKSRLAAVWRLIGKFYISKRDYPKADTALLKSKSYAIASGDKNNIVETYQGLGDLRGRQYYKTGEERYYRESMEYLKACLPIQKENFFYTYELIAYNFSDRFYRLNGDPPTTYSSDADSAIIYYRQAMREAQKEGVLGLMKTMVNNIFIVCNDKQRVTGKDCSSLLGDENYNDFLNGNYAALVDTMRSELKASNKHLREFEERIQLVANERRETRNWFISGTGLLVAAIIFLILLQIQQRKRFQARLDALRAQINPHFFANSLNAIESLVNLDQREAASKYIIHFSRLSRKILTSSRDAATSLKEEIQTLKHFLAMEQLRFRDKLTYVIGIDPNLNPEEIEVPALILQPYVENAILHGIKPKSVPGEVKIEAKRVGKSLVCIVEDDGVGREKSKEIQRKSALSPQHKSQGMKINEERLKIVGKTKGAKVEIIDLFDETGAAAGTRVKISLPLKHRHL